jgi:hypothetical protein
MFFMRRAGEPFTVRSRKWSFAPEDHNAPTCMVEIFASDRNAEGAASRQVGAFGPHTIDDEGKVTISYAWKGPSPKDVPAICRSSRSNKRRRSQRRSIAWRRRPA